MDYLSTTFGSQNLEVQSWNTLKLALTLLILVIFSIFLVLAKFPLRRRYFNKLFPGKKFSLWDPLGHLAEMKTNRIQKSGKSQNAAWVELLHLNAQLFKKEKLFCFWISYEPLVFLLKAEAVEAVLKGTKMLEKGWIYEWLEDIFGTGLVTSRGSKWKSHRKLLTPCFQTDILNNFVPVFNEKAQILVKRLRSQIEEDSTDISMPVTLCVLDVLCETVFGVKLAVQEKGEMPYAIAARRTTRIVMARLIKWWLWPNFIFRCTALGQEFFQHTELMKEFTRSIIREKKRELLNPGAEVTNKRDTMMDLLLNLHLQTDDFSEEDIREEVDTFALAGHETTAAGIIWALYSIGLDRDVQDRINQELDHTFGDNLEREVTVDDMNNMKYLECVLKETKRLYPPIPVMVRLVTEDYNICGYTVPKGTSCVIPTYLLHRDEEVFPDPEKFDPSRFFPENSMKRSPYAYVPFSAGPRNCIGRRFSAMQEKVVVSTILRNFTIESLDGREKVRPKFNISLNSSIPIRLKIRTRASLK